MFCFDNLPLHQEFIITSCNCEERFNLMGIRDGEIFKLIEECPFGGTVILQNRLGLFCVRRDEIELKCEFFKKG